MTEKYIKIKQGKWKKKSCELKNTLIYLLVKYINEFNTFFKLFNKLK